MEKEKHNLDTCTGIPYIKLEEMDQVDFLAKFLITEFNDEIGKGKSPNGEGAIEMAVRLLNKSKSSLQTVRLETIEEIENGINMLPVYYRSKFSASNPDSDGVEMILLEQFREAIKKLKEL